MTPPPPSLKGAFLDVGAGLAGDRPNLVEFQFNPETVTRTPRQAQAPRGGDGSGRVDTYQQPDEPHESISFTFHIDATDQLTGPGRQLAIERGILPTLSALELLMQSRTQTGPDLAALSGSKSPALNPPVRIPAVLFYWGLWRVIPVTFSSLSIVETEFDINLNPVRADVSVNLEVLTPSQIAKDDAWGNGAYVDMRAVKLQMASLNAANARDIGVNSANSIHV